MVNSFKLFKLISINLIIIFSLIIFIEFSFKLYFEKKINCLYVLCDVEYIYNNNLYEPYDKVTYKRDKFGFRGRYKEVDKIDILVSGGSTTDERLLNLEDTWIEKLENNFLENGNIKIDIVNAGIDGQSSFGHIWNFENWFKKIDNLSFKYIIFYVGLNESTEGSNFDLKSDNLSIYKKIKIFIKKNNGFVYRVFSIYQKYFTNKNINYGENISNTNFILNENILDDDDIAIKKVFLHNLHKLMELSKNFNAIPIFVSQRSSRWEKKGSLIYTMNNNNFYLKEKNLSNIMMNFCNSIDLICVDLFTDLKLKREDTYDLMHLNPIGSNKVANLIYQKIKDKIYIYN